MRLIKILKPFLDTTTVGGYNIAGSKGITGKIITI